MENKLKYLYIILKKEKMKVQDQNGKNQKSQKKKNQEKMNTISMRK